MATTLLMYICHSQAELLEIEEMRRRLKTVLNEPGISKTDDIIGNLSMLRFLRAHTEEGGMDLVCQKFEVQRLV